MTGKALKMLIIVLSNNVKNWISPKCPTSTLQGLLVVIGCSVMKPLGSQSQADRTEQLIDTKDTLPKKKTGTKIMLKVWLQLYIYFKEVG